MQLYMLPNSDSEPSVFVACYWSHAYWWFAGGETSVQLSITTPGSGGLREMAAYALLEQGSSTKCLESTLSAIDLVI